MPAADAPARAAVGPRSGSKYFEQYEQQQQQQHQQGYGSSDSARFRHGAAAEAPSSFSSIAAEQRVAAIAGAGSMVDRPYQQGGGSSSYGSSGIDSGYGYGGSFGGDGMGAGSGSGKGWGGLLKSVTKSAVSTAATLGKKGLKAAQVGCGGDAAAAEL
jgi:hypothetical protein